jgi:nicotinamide-nucleotide amidase
MSDRTQTLAQQMGDACRVRGVVITGAESCTGGLVAGAITSVSGSSAWFDCGFITYSNEAKHVLLGVRVETLERFGAVSEETAAEMANGALINSRATLAFSVTGVAGPSGGTAQKPVGMVCFGFANKASASASATTSVYTKHFVGDRAQIRAQSVEFVLAALLRVLSDGAESVNR